MEVSSHQEKIFLASLTRRETWNKKCDKKKIKEENEATYSKNNKSEDANCDKKRNLFALTAILQFPVRIHHSLCLFSGILLFSFCEKKK